MFKQSPIKSSLLLRAVFRLERSSVESSPSIESSRSIKSSPSIESNHQEQSSVE